MSEKFSKMINNTSFAEGNTVTLLSKIQGIIAKSNIKNGDTAGGLPPNKIDIHPEMSIRESVAVFTYARCNPPTIGHRKLFEKIISESKKYNCEHYVFLTQTQNKKTDPLTLEEKIYFISEAIPTLNIVRDANIHTLVEAIKSLEEKKVEHLVLVVGEDRADYFKDLIEKYNGEAFSFKKFDVVSAGVRNILSEDPVERISSTKLREYVSEGNKVDFELECISRDVSKDLFEAVAENMGLNELYYLQSDGSWGTKKGHGIGRKKREIFKGSRIEESGLNRIPSPMDRDTGEPLDGVDVGMNKDLKGKKAIVPLDANIQLKRDRAIKRFKNWIDP